MQQNAQPTTIKTKKISSPQPAQPKKQKRGKGIINLLLFIGIIGAVALFIWAEQQRRDALSQLEQTEQQLEEIKQSTEKSGQQVADEIVGKIREHMDIPTDPQPTVATIIDVDRLRETSDFYNKANNGDHLILTETRAILYNAERNIILDVVPVILNPEDVGDAGTGDNAATPDTEENPTEGEEGGNVQGQQNQANPANNNNALPDQNNANNAANPSL